MELTNDFPPTTISARDPILFIFDDRVELFPTPNTSSGRREKLKDWIFTAIFFRETAIYALLLLEVLPSMVLQVLAT